MFENFCLLFFARAKLASYSVLANTVINMRDDRKIMNWLLFIEMLCCTNNDVFQVHYQEKPPTDYERKAIANEARMLIAKYDEIKDDHCLGRYRRQLTVDKLCHHMRRFVIIRHHTAT